MNHRLLTITLQPDWKAALRQAGRRATKSSYQGEVLNFESPGAFFGRMTARRWAIVRALQGQGVVGVRPGGHPNSPTDGHPKFPHPGAVAMTS